jgi:hypothetical protein
MDNKQGVCMTDKGKEGAQQGNQNAVKHGGAAAVKAITKHADFAGLALQTQNGIQGEYDTQGAGKLIAKDAVRLQTASELYFNAFMKSASDGDLEGMESYLKVYTWVTNSAVRALESAHKHDKKDDSHDADTIIATYREVKDA